MYRTDTANAPHADTVRAAARRRLYRHIEAVADSLTHGADPTHTAGVMTVLRDARVTVIASHRIRVYIPAPSRFLTYVTTAINAALDVDLTHLGADDTTANRARIHPMDNYTADLTW